MTRNQEAKYLDKARALLEQIEFRRHGAYDLHRSLAVEARAYIDLARELRARREAEPEPVPVFTLPNWDKGRQHPKREHPETRALQALYRQGQKRLVKAARSRAAGGRV